MHSEYQTVQGEAIGEYIEKRSRFIATLSQVENEQQALEIIHRIKTKNHDARHNCYAYIISEQPEIQRYSDDGEPQGTAGIPILEVLKRKQLSNVIIIVSRYFGGILLGAPGLVRAYSKAAATAVDNADIILRKMCIETTVTIDYNIHGKLSDYIKRLRMPVKDVKFLHHVEIVLYLTEDEMPSFEKRMMEISNGSAKIVKGIKDFISFTLDGVLIK